MYKPKNYDHSKFANPRNTDIYLLRIQGKGYKEIAEKHGISRVRARQIFEEYQYRINRGYIKIAKLEYIGNDIIDVFRCTNCHAFIIDEDCKECPSCKAIFEENKT